MMPDAVSGSVVGCCGRLYYSRSLSPSVLLRRVWWGSLPEAESSAGLFIPLPALWPCQARVFLARKRAFFAAGCALTRALATHRRVLVRPLLNYTRSPALVISELNFSAPPPPGYACSLRYFASRLCATQACDWFCENYETARK